MDTFVKWAYGLGIAAFVPLVHAAFLIFDPADLPGKIGENRTPFLVVLCILEPLTLGAIGFWSGWRAKTHREEPSGKDAAILAALMAIAAIPIRFGITGLRYDWF